jgi:hypothetical protein
VRRDLVEAQLLVVVRAHPLGGVDGAFFQRLVDFATRDVLRHTAHALGTLPAKPPTRNFRPLMSATDLISLRYQPPICAPVLPIGKLTMLYLGVELAHQLQAVAVIHPGRHLAAVQAEREWRSPSAKVVVLPKK